MSSFYELMGLAAGVCALADIGVYILAIFGLDFRLRRIPERTVPNRATWFIWSTIGIVLAVSYYQSGATDTIWFPAAYAFGFATVALLSIRYGEGGFGRTDILALLGALLSAGAWWLFRSPQIALYATTAIDMFGAIPTIRKSWREPWKENRLAWTLGTAGSVANILAIDWFTATFAIAVYPIAIFIANVFITLPLFLKYTK